MPKQWFWPFFSLSIGKDISKSLLTMTDQQGWNGSPIINMLKSQLEQLQVCDHQLFDYHAPTHKNHLSTHLICPMILLLSIAGVDESSASIIGDNNIFIGRHFDQTSTSWLPGSIEVPRRSSGFGVMRVFNSRGQMSEESKGDILVGILLNLYCFFNFTNFYFILNSFFLLEIEPVHYEVEIHSSASGENEPQRTKKILRSDVVLAKSSLFRFNEGRDVEARMQKVLSYDYEKSEYYGQVGEGVKITILQTTYVSS